MGCRNNIFIINGIIYDVLSSVKKDPIILQIYDYQQMFDAMFLEEAVIDMFDIGICNEDLGLIYEANKKIHMAIKIPFGLSERKVVKNSVLQGDTFGPSFASVQVEKIGKNAIENGYFYLYKNEVPIWILGMVDDVIGITKTGHRAIEL